MEELKRSITVLLLADDAVVEEFQERFTLKPICRFTRGCTWENQDYFRSDASFQIEGNDRVGVVAVVETQDGVRALEVYVDDKRIEVQMDKALATTIRAFITSDESLQVLFGENVRVKQLSRGDHYLTSRLKGHHEDEEEKQDEPPMEQTFASFKVVGSKGVGVVSVAASPFHGTEFIVYVGNDKIRIHPCRGALKSFSCYPKSKEYSSAANSAGLLHA